MRANTRFTAALALAAAGLSACSHLAPGPAELRGRPPPESADARAPSAVRDTSMRAVDPLDPSLGAPRLLVFVATDCPIVRRYAPEIARCLARCREQGVLAWLVYADPDATSASIESYQREFRLDAEALLDPEHVLVARARASATPEVALFDERGELLYRGRIDDRAQDFDRWRAAPERAELRAALDALRDRSLALPLPVSGVGCPIPPPRYEPRPGGSVTWRDSIEPIVRARCAGCHVAGGIAPFALDGHAAVAKRAAHVLDVVERGIMPPWRPSPRGLELEDENRPTARELGLLRQWVAEGASLGSTPPATAPAPAFSAAAPLVVPGTEELALRLAEPWELPAEGGDRTRSFVLPIGLAEDRWVRGLTVEPSPRAPFHHALLYLDPTGQARERDALDAGGGFQGMIELDAGTGFERGGWGPGVLPRALPDGTAWLLPAGADLVLDVHLVPTGRTERIDVAVRLHVTPDPPERALLFARLGIEGIHLCAGAPPWTGHDELVLPRAAILHGLIPHAHQICRTVRVDAVLPGDRRVLLLEIPDWHFSWQMQYRLKRPLELPAGTVLETWFTYDNGASNPRNPHAPPRRVIGGPRGTDEMGVVWLELGVRRGEDERAIAGQVAQHAEDGKAEVALVDLRQNLVAQFDVDRDGSLDAAEDAELVRWVRALPPDGEEMRQATAFFDADGDGALDAAERAALERFRGEW